MNQRGPLVMRSDWHFTSHEIVVVRWLTLLATAVPGTFGL
jgi:hypothetical protein